MTPEERIMAEALIAVAWADGKVAAPEQAMIDGLIWAFGAGAEDEQLLGELARKPRKLGDVPLEDLGVEARALLLSQAALLTHADGEQTPDEAVLLVSLVARLGLDKDVARAAIDGAATRAAKLATGIKRT